MLDKRAHFKSYEEVKTLDRQAWKLFNLKRFSPILIRFNTDTSYGDKYRHQPSLSRVENIKSLNKII